MKRMVFVVCALIGLGSWSYGDDAYGQGWTQLFDGKTLDGWEQINGYAKFEVKDGVILGTTAKGSPNSFLCSKKHYGNFILEFEVFLHTDDLNSGVQIRSESKPEYQNGRVHGYQVEIATNGNSGFIYDEARRGWLTENRDNAQAKAAFKAGKWNRYRVLCQGDTIITWINNILISHIEDGMTPQGFIGLQVHSYNGEQPGQVAWRNIQIKELPAKGLQERRR